MKAVILAGGFGTRICEETTLKPKPMVNIGGRPILWHIMKIFSYYGCNEFILCLGYKSHVIKEYFANYHMHHSDVTFHIQSNATNFHKTSAEPWKVTCIDTGLKTMTGGRLKRIKKYLGDEPFFMTYGDGVADINLNKLQDFHQSHDALATITAVQPQGRFGALGLDGSKVTAFQEKPKGDGAWINGGFFVLDPKVIDFIDGDEMMFEKEPLERLTNADQLRAYKHSGFWKPMDTLRDRHELDALWESGNAPWKSWNED